MATGCLMPATRARASARVGVTRRCEVVRCRLGVPAPVDAKGLASSSSSSSSSLRRVSVRAHSSGGRNAALYAGGDEFHMSKDPSYDKEMMKFVGGLMWPNLELPWGVLAASTAVAVGVALMHLHAPAVLEYLMPLKFTQSFITMPLGFLMVFRINQAYGRWWEARGSVGQIMTRSMVLAEIGSTGELPQTSALRVASLCRALLVAIEAEFSIGGNPEDKWTKLASRVSAEDLAALKADKGNTVNAVIYMMREEFSRAASGIDAAATKMTAAATLLEVHTFLTACRRIFTTPMPISYTAQFRFVLVIYLAALPFTLLGQVGPYFTVPINILISMALFGLDALSGGIINPFGTDSDDLPMNRYIKAADDNVANVQAKIKERSAN